MRYYRYALPLLFLAGSVWLINPALSQESKDKKEPENAPVPKAKGPPPFCGLGIVFVANSVYNDDELTQGLAASLRSERLPFAMETIRWTTGHGTFSDYRNVDRHAEAAAFLASKVMAFRKVSPNGKVIFMAHGSGSHVVLLAASMLPPKSIERVILLVPSVSCRFDLRPALLAARSGVDNYWNPEDNVLEWAEEQLGTSDLKRCATAGRAGFTALPPQFPGSDLYRNLRQYRWSPNSRYGHVGVHFGWTREQFLRCHALPLFLTTEVPAQPVSRPKVAD